MIITLITIFVLIVGIALIVIYNHSWRHNDWMLSVGIALMMIGIFTLMITGFTIIYNQVTKDINYQNTLYEKEMLEYRIDNMEENIVGNEMLYNDIIEFNNGLRSVKKWANNPWLNWFYNEDIAAIDYIDYVDLD